MIQPEPRSWKRDGFLLSTDRSLLDFPRIHAFLSQTYWSKRIPRALVERAAGNSLCFGLYREQGAAREQIGYARVMGDLATFAYLADVYVEDAWRGRGLSKWMMEAIMGHPDLQGLRMFCLRTRDAHGLYARFGFKPIEKPEAWMEIRELNLYERWEAEPGLLPEFLVVLDD